MTTIATLPRQSRNCRAWGGCTPDNRCDEHRDREPEKLGDLAAEYFAMLRPDRPKLYLVKGGKR